MLRLQHAQSSVACHRGADLRNLALGFYAFSPALELFSISISTSIAPQGIAEYVPGISIQPKVCCLSYLQIHPKITSLSFLVSVQYIIIISIPLSYLTAFLLRVFCSLSDWLLFSPALSILLTY